MENILIGTGIVFIITSLIIGILIYSVIGWNIFCGFAGINQRNSGLPDYVEILVGFIVSLLLTGVLWLIGNTVNILIK